MFRRNAGPLTLSAGLIALYLVVQHPSALKTFLTEGPKGAGGVIKSFQGR